MAEDAEDFTFVNREKCKLLEEEFKKSGIAGVSTKIKERLKSYNDWTNTPLLIGVTGNSGVGKSSFINAIRGIRPDQNGAAKTGVTETTKTVKYYPHPDNDMLKLADLPGVGTAEFTRDNYCEKVEFDEMDMFVIITSTRFTDQDIWLAKEILNRKKHFLFLRTKVVQDLKNDMDDYPVKYKENKEKFIRVKIDEIRKSTEDGLRKELGDIGNEHFKKDHLKVFLIDSKDPRHPKLDFSEFTKKLIKDFPRNKKGALILSLSLLTPGLIDEKEKILKNQIWKHALQSAAGGAIPVPGVSLTIDVGIIVRAAKEYRKQFGLEPDTLEQVLQSVNSTTSEICESAGLRSVGIELTGAGILRLCSGLFVREGIENVSAFVPVLGQIFGSLVSYKGTSYSLGKVLTIMADDARKVQDYIQCRLLETEL